MIKIYESIDNKENATITNNILRQLPEWFGIEESIVEYVDGVRNSYFLIASDSDKPVGFLSIKKNNAFTSEVYVIGILKSYHKQGIGKALIKIAAAKLRENAVKFLMVKTLSESHSDKNYQVTRQFYRSIGFYPLQEIKEIWGNENPCLLMVKCL